MDKRQLLRSVRNKEYNSLDELVTETARIIPHIAHEQKRYKVSVYPDERTIRYYINEGLVDRPVTSKDKQSRFTYKHLLQILTIKHLQAQYLLLNKIREMLTGLDEDELEEILTGKQKVSSINLDMASPLHRSSFIQRSMMQKSDILCSPLSERVEIIEDYIESDTPEEWLRISVTDDVELNIRAGSIPKTPKKRKEFMERLAAKLRIYLENEKKQGGI